MNRDLSSFLRGYREPDGNIKDFSHVDNLEPVPYTAGAYIFLSQEQKFVYPEGESKIIYIGQSLNLYNRLCTHLSNFKSLSNMKPDEMREYWYYSRYHYFRKFGIQVYWYSIRGTQTAKNLESELLDWFYDKWPSDHIAAKNDNCFVNTRFTIL